jgi:hypothetical protein
LPKKKPAHAFWPNLGFVTMKHKNVSWGNCQKCYEVCQAFMKSNSLSWSEVVKSESFCDLVCQIHKNRDKRLSSNVICIYKETKRHCFKEFLFADQDLNIPDVELNSFENNYCDNPLPMTFKPTKRKNRDFQSVTSCFSEKLSNMKSTDALTKFLRFISEEDNFANYTFLMDDKCLVRIKQT